MLWIFRCMAGLALVATIHIVMSCNPSEPEVNSPGAGNFWTFTMVSGDGQSTAVFDTLDNRLVVKLARINGTAVANEFIRFYLVSGNGAVQKPVLGSDIFDLVTPTDFAGEASAQFLNYGGDSTTGFSTIRAEVEDSAQYFVIFTIGTI